MRGMYISYYVVKLLFLSLKLLHPKIILSQMNQMLPEYNQ
jgi:hypothetical protein